MMAGRSWCSIDERFCSHEQHYWLAQTITFRLPWWPGAAALNGVDPKSPPFLYGPDDMPAKYKAMVSGPAVTPLPDQSGVLVTFTLPPPGVGARMNGELH